MKINGCKLHTIISLCTYYKYKLCLLSFPALWLLFVIYLGMTAFACVGTSWGAIRFRAGCAHRSSSNSPSFWVHEGGGFSLLQTQTKEGQTQDNYSSVSITLIFSGLKGPGSLWEENGNASVADMSALLLVLQSSKPILKDAMFVVIWAIPSYSFTCGKILCL